MTGINLDEVTKVYSNGVKAVDAVDLEIAEGEFVVLVGPSGCGKSTLLRMIAGLEDVTDGAISIGGVDVTDMPPQKRDIAMVFQNYALYPHMTVRDNLAYGLKLRKLPKAEVRRRVEHTARKLGLEDLLDRKPSRLSGGQRQRVAMGRAIVREPKAFLMDEPLSNLDAKLRVQMRVEIAKIQRRLGTTTIYVTHDQTEAMTLGDRVAVMRAGVLQQVAAPGELYERPANVFVAGFIGSPAMNLLDGELGDGHVRTSLGDLPLPDDLRRAAEARGPADGAVTVGIRPEAFQDPAVTGDGGPAAEVTVLVDLVESVGSDLYVYGAAGDDDIVARLTPASRPAAGGPVRLRVPTAALHLFDRAGGATLRTG
jgi:multiple sugar transport system ATP-binding protein